MRGLCDLVQGKRGCRIAGNHQHFDALILQEMRGFNSVPSDGFNRL